MKVLVFTEKDGDDNDGSDDDDYNHDGDDNCDGDYDTARQGLWKLSEVIRNAIRNLSLSFWLILSSVR